MSDLKKFGTFAGVFTPSLLTILGVIMYLRMGWVVGNAGLEGSIIIILFAHIISVTTGLSVSSISTDKKIKAGGIYYLLSRSLGLPIGGAIGITLFIGTCLSIALYLIGFAEVFNSVVGLGNDLNSFRVVGSISLVSITILALISTSIAIKSQFIILATIILSLVSIFLGDASGIVLNTETIIPEDVSISEIFGVFFPAVTGFTAGVAMSGDLKNPKKSIPIGTMSSILVGLFVYIFLAFFLYYNIDASVLKTNNNILTEMAWIPNLVIAGVWGATLSSALGGILGAPRILQALSLDNIGPKVFSKGVGKNNEPRNAIILTFIIAEAGVLIGELDLIARIVSMFYLTAYGFINLAAFLENWANSDFRPSLKISNWIPAIGFIITFGIMIQIDVLAMFGSFIIMGVIFFYLTKKQLSIGAGDVWQSVWNSVVKYGIKRIDNDKTSNLNWFPNVLLFTVDTNFKDKLIGFSKSLAKKSGMISHFELIEKPDASVLFPKTIQNADNTQLEKDGIFARKQICKDHYQGIETIAATYGFTGIVPNTILMGWNSNTSHPKKFTSLTKQLVNLNFNVLFLDYDENKKFGEFSTIDIWWREKNNNADLSLNIVKYLLRSDEWENAKLRIIYINNSTSSSNDIELQIQKAIDDFRINAEIILINNFIEKRSFNELSTSISAETDLIIAGIPTINNEDKFIADTNNLFQVLGTTLLVKASTSLNEINIENSKQSNNDIKNIQGYVKNSITNPTFDEIVDTSLKKNISKLYKDLSDIKNNCFDFIIQDTLKYNQKVLNSLENQNENIETAIKLNEEKLNDIEFYKNSLKNNIIKLIEELNNLPKNHLESIKIKISIDEELKYIKTKRRRLYYKTTKLFKKNRQKNIYWKDLIKYRISIEYITSLNKILNQLILLNYAFEQDLIKLINDEIKRENVILNYQLSYKKLNNLIDYSNLTFCNNLITQTKIPHTNSHNEKIFLNIKKPSKNTTLKFSNVFSENFIVFRNLTIEEAILNHHKKQLNQTINDLSELTIKEGANRYLEDINRGMELLKNNHINDDYSFKLLNDLDLSSNILFDKMKLVKKNIIENSPENISFYSSNDIKNLSSIFSDNEFQTNKINFKRNFKWVYDSINSTIIKNYNRITLEFKNITNDINQIYSYFNYSLQNIDENQSITELINLTLDQLEHKIPILEKLIQKNDFLTDNTIQHINDKLNINYILFSANNLNYLNKELKNQKIGEKIKKINHFILDYYSEKINSIKLFLYQNKLEDKLNVASCNINFEAKKYIRSKEINVNVLKKLPYFYPILFSGKDNSSKENKVIPSELNKTINDVLNILKNDSLSILITGSPLSGKTFILNHIIKNIESNKTITLSKNSSNDISFYEYISKEFNLKGKLGVSNFLSELPEKTIIVIDNIEFWWSRKNKGLNNIETLIQWITTYSHITFILTTNNQSHKILNNWLQINNYIDTVIQIPNYDFKNMCEIIFQRHGLSNLKLEYKNHLINKNKYNIALDLFKDIHKCSKGNIGEALLLFPSFITNYENNRIILKRTEKYHFPVITNKNDISILIQLLIFKSLNTKQIHQFTVLDIETININISVLLKNNIVFRDLYNNYSVNPLVKNLLIEQFKNNY